MRGLLATIGMSDPGTIGEHVARQLGHASVETTTESYAQRGTVQRAQQERALKVLDGGRK
jgi:hypothetical protein